MSFQQKRKKIIPLLILFAIYAAIFLLGKSIPEENLRQLIMNAGVYGPLVIILLSLLTYILAPLNGMPVLIIGYYAYGQQVILYAAIAIFLSTITNFWIARIFGVSIVKRLIGAGAMNKLDKFTQNYGLLALFISRVFLRGYHDLISYAAGLTNMKFSGYLLVSTIGLIPGVLLWYYLTSLVDDPVSFALISYAEIAVFLLLFALGSLLLRTWKRTRRKPLATTE